LIMHASRWSSGLIDVLELSNCCSWRLSFSLWILVVLIITLGLFYGFVDTDIMWTLEFMLMKSLVSLVVLIDFRDYCCQSCYHFVLGFGVVTFSLSPLKDQPHNSSIPNPPIEVPLGLRPHLRHAHDEYFQ
jgi:hypothetical protein